MSEEELPFSQDYIDYKFVLMALKKWLEEYKDIGEFRLVLDKIKELEEA